LLILAKSIAFGLAYGRGAAAIARAAQEEGYDVSLDDVQKVTETLLTRYPMIVDYQNAACARVADPGWMASCFGRYRRFIGSSDQGVMAGLERTATNFPCQSSVADAMNKALYHLFYHKRRKELGYRIVLQIHDAVLLEVPVSKAKIVYDEILPECLTQKVGFYSCDLNGVPYKDSPLYRFATDRKVFTRWGEELSWDDCDKLGLQREFGCDKS
jgi:DNA polymerase-1